MADDGGRPAEALQAGDLTHRYLWGPAVDQILADEQVESLDEAGQVVWPLADPIGTVRDLVLRNAETGIAAVANHRVYDSFGNLRSQTSTAVDCLFAFTGRPLDTATGLQNNWNRWYDPQLRRWASEDPIGLAGGDGNTARYCLNRSTVESDANGLSFWSDYWHYLSNPWDMDDDLETGFYLAAGTAVVTGAAAGGLVAAGYGAVTVTAAAKAAVPVVVSELADTAVEEGLSAVTGVPVVLPVSAVDAVQDLGKMALKKAAREAVENATESAAKRLAPEVGIKANKLAGDAARDAIAAREAPALIEQSLRVTGGLRRVDVLKQGDAIISIESKVGRTGLGQSGSRVRQELARDIKLLRSGQVDECVWEFSRSATTGKIGPTGPLLQKLQQHGITVRITDISY